MTIRDYVQIFAAMLGGGLLGRWVSSMSKYADPIDLMAEGREKLKDREASSGKRFSRDNPRSIDGIDSIVLHQMGFSRGSDPMKYLGVPAHYVVMPSGVVAQLHPWETYLYTSNALNSRSIGVEIAGNFPNEDGNWWSPEKFGTDQPTPEQLNAIKGLVRYIDRGLRDQGQRLLGVYAHRQSSAAKRNDPGPDVWRAVSPVFAELGLEDVSGFATGGGAPIPESWKASRGGVS